MTQRIHILLGKPRVFSLCTMQTKGIYDPTADKILQCVPAARLDAPRQCRKNPKQLDQGTTFMQEAINTNVKAEIHTTTGQAIFFQK